MGQKGERGVFVAIVYPFSYRHSILHLSSIITDTSAMHSILQSCQSCQTQPRTRVDKRLHKRIIQGPTSEKLGSRSRFCVCVDCPKTRWVVLFVRPCMSFSLPLCFLTTQPPGGSSYRSATSRSAQRQDVPPQSSTAFLPSQSNSNSRCIRRRRISTRRQSCRTFSASVFPAA